MLGTSDEEIERIEQEIVEYELKENRRLLRIRLYWCMTIFALLALFARMYVQ